LIQFHVFTLMLRMTVWVVVRKKAVLLEWKRMSAILFLNLYISRYSVDTRGQKYSKFWFYFKDTAAMQPRILETNVCCCGHNIYAWANSPTWYFSS
jgi:hypothetical protein